MKQQQEHQRTAGAEWLPELPKGWEVRRLKNVATIRFSNVDKNSNLDERPVRLCNYLDVYKNEFIKNDMNFMSATATLEEIAKFEVKKGDVMITKDSETPADIAVPALAIEELENVVCGYHLAQIRALPDVILPEFLFRLFQSKIINAHYEVAATGVTRFGLSVFDIESVRLPLPPLPVQARIVRYLDEKTAQIRLFLEKKARFVALLREERQAVVNEAVTRGIDPGARLRPSGVDWLGDVPEGWEVRRLKECIETTVSGGTPSMDNREYWDGDIPWVSPKDMKSEKIETAQMFVTEKALDESVLKLVPKGSILMVVRSGILRSTLPIGITETEVTINQDIKALTFRERTIHAEYFKWLVIGIEQTILVNCRKQVATVESIEMPLFMAFKIPVPPLPEQARILAHLRLRTEQIDAAISKAEREMALMREYREALIAEAVTGRMEIK